MDHSELVEHNSFILFLDLKKKAFDLFEHNFIFKSVENFGFGKYICKAMNSLL